VGIQVRHVVDVTARESRMILDFVWDILHSNHDLQLRFQWGQDDVAIWDNRSVFHAMTYDYDDSITRLGMHFSGVGEVPYLDPESRTRKEWFDRQVCPTNGN
jgi:alpha-ketoglutarate-dependent taurine dioxygenase